MYGIHDDMSTMAGRDPVYDNKTVTKTYYANYVAHKRNWITSVIYPFL